MSRIGKKPITLPSGVDIEWKDGRLTVKGPLGILSRQIPLSFRIEKEGTNLIVRPVEEGIGGRSLKELYGLYRTLIANMVTGVSQGYRKTLELIGTGYKFEMKGTNILEINAGFSHKVAFPLPPGIVVRLGEKNLKVTLEGIDKEQVGQIAANIRKIRPPEPYQGKGIRYEGEKIKLKAGKAGKAAGGGAGG